MKLDDYFRQQRNIHTSDNDKLELYQKIMSKKINKSLSRKSYLFHVKTFSYSFLIAVLLVGLYGIYFVNNTSDNGGIIIQPQVINGVQADYIAKVVEFEGSFVIEQDGKNIQTSNIKNGDIITLKEGAQMIFHIDQETQATIKGPAKFTLNHSEKEDRYQLALAYGDFVEMQSLNNKNNQKLELSTKDIVVKKDESRDPVHFQLVKEDNTHVVKNKGSNIKVQQTNSKKELEVKADQLVAIQNNDITLIENVEQFKKAIKNKNISQTFKIANNKSVEKDQSKTKVNTAINIQETTEKIDPELEKSLDAVVANGKGVLSPNQSQVLTNISKNAEKHVRNIMVSYVEGQQSTFEQAYNILSKDIKSVYGLVSAEYNYGGTSNNSKVLSIADAVNKLISELEKDYHISPSQLDNLRAISSAMSLTQQAGFNSTDDGLAVWKAKKSKLNFK